MSEHPREPCPVCGKEVSTLPVAWSQHAKTHAAQPEPEPKEVQPVSDEATVAVPPEDAPKASGEFDAVKDAQMRRVLELAKAAQDRFVAAPQVFVGDTTSNEHMELRKQYLPESFNVSDPKTGKLIKRAEWHEFFDDPAERMETYAARGYFPVMDETGKQVVSPNGSRMWKRLSKIHDAVKDAPAAESRRVMKAMDEKMASDTRDPLTVDADVGAVRIEQSSVTEEGIDDG